MLSFDILAEQRILEAIERGELDSLPGAGRPLASDDDPLVPEELRVAYRILKNAGFVPPEVETLRRIGDLQRLLEGSTDAGTRNSAQARLSLLRAHLETRNGARPALAESRYRARLLAKLDRSTK